MSTDISKLALLAKAYNFGSDKGYSIEEDWRIPKSKNPHLNDYKGEFCKK